jgi:hypothetical protein
MYRKIIFFIFHLKNIHIKNLNSKIIKLKYVIIKIVTIINYQNMLFG